MTTTMKLYEVRSRRYFTEDEVPRKGKGKVWQDAVCIVEASSLDEAQHLGFEAALGTKFFGVPESHCQCMEVASIALPFFTWFA